jgi:hypothetical protein
MWQLDNRTPFSSGQGWVRNRDGAEVWLVVVKCTYDIKPDGTIEISRHQAPVVRAPEYNGQPGKSSIRFDSEFVLTKATTDIVVIGHAYAPNGDPVRELDAGFRLGSVEKLVRVFCDRTWNGATISTPARFSAMPLLYERAFGGVDLGSEHPERDWEWRNPVGVGFAVSASNAYGQAIPNFEYSDQLIQSWQDRPTPAGLGVIGSSWQPRASLSGTYDAKWADTRQPLLPEDFDDRFFQCAPADQQSPQFLTGGESVTLLNLCRESPLNFKLPLLELVLETRFMDGERREHETPKLHGVILEPDFPRVSLVWHSAIECHAEVYNLERTRIEIRRQEAGEDDDAELDSLLDVI